MLTTLAVVALLALVYLGAMAWVAMRDPLPPIVRVPRWRAYTHRFRTLAVSPRALARRSADRAALYLGEARATAGRVRGGMLAGFIRLVKRAHVGLTAAILGVRGWWAAQLCAWDALLADKPTLARAFPLLALVVAFVRSQFTPRALQAVAVALLVTVFTAAPAWAVPLLPGSVRHLRAYDQLADLPMAVTTAGNRQYRDLEQVRAIRYLQLRFEGQVDIATADGTAVRNLGIISAAYSELGVTGGGDGDIVRADPRALEFASEWMLNASSLSRTRLTAFVVGTYGALASMSRIWFENPQSVKSSETILLQKEPSSRLQFFATLSPQTTGAATSSAGSGRLVTGAATSVVTLSALNIRINQINHTALSELPLFRPNVSEVRYPASATNTDFQCIIPVASNEYLRGLTVFFVDANQMVLGTASILDFQLLGDNYSYIGQGPKVLLASYVEGQAYETGMDPLALWAGRAFHYNFQQGARLSNLYNPSQDTNLRFVFNISIAPPAGFTIVVVKHSLFRDMYVGPAPDFRRVVSETLPAELAELRPAA